MYTKLLNSEVKNEYGIVDNYLYKKQHRKAVIMKIEKKRMQI
jgi:hypothetical protein